MNYANEMFVGNSKNTYIFTKSMIVTLTIRKFFATHSSSKRLSDFD